MKRAANALFCSSAADRALSFSSSAIAALFWQAIVKQNRTVKRAIHRSFRMILSLSAMAHLNFNRQRKSNQEPVFFGKACGELAEVEVRLLP
jgi:hypothetical protein